jgi:hypothetical protein
VAEQAAEVNGHEFGLGRLPKEDERDYVIWQTPFAFPTLRAIGGSGSWVGAWLDQNGFPHCVGYSWTRWLEDGLVRQPTPVGDAAYADDLYRECQRNDEWPGEDYAGTSVRAGAKVLKSRGLITNYYFAFDIEKCQVERARAGAGGPWYRSMFNPVKYDSRTYVCKVNESSGSDVAKLLEDSGEMCLATEIRA